MTRTKNQPPNVITTLKENYIQKNRTKRTKGSLTMERNHQKIVPEKYQVPL
jgi:hypothetical protein